MVRALCMVLGLCLIFFGLTACEPSAPSDLLADDAGFGIKPSEIVSGDAFLTPETRTAQNDPFENPGFLWVDSGAQIFKQDCAGCHASQNSDKSDQETDRNAPRLDGVLVKYPKIEPRTGELINLQGRINLCRSTHMEAPPYDYESRAMLSLSAYLAERSRGVSRTSPLPEDMKAYFKEGEEYYFTKRGQFNFSCHQCHDKNWGQTMRGDKISQGHGTGFPTYRNAWQGLGSLHRRFRECDIGVRAEPNVLGGPEYTSLELYLAYRAQGLPINAPSMRR